MCDGNNEIPILSSGVPGSIPTKYVTRRQLQRFEEDFVIIDVREEKEFNGDDKKKLINGIINLPVGLILSTGWRQSENSKKVFGNKKKVCFVCPRGPRSDLVARWYNANTTYDCYTLKKGYSSFDEPFAKDDDWVVILGYGEDNPEKVGLALNLVNAGAAKGKTSTLILMANGVWLGTKSFREKQKLKLSNVFKPWEESLANLISKHGQIICCTTCLNERKITDQDLIKEAIKMQGPDLVDIMQLSGKVLQFM